MSDELVLVENGKILCTCHTMLIALDLQTLLKDAGRETEVRTIEWCVVPPTGYVPFKKSS
jgi:hypothetical protein